MGEYLVISAAALGGCAALVRMLARFHEAPYRLVVPAPAAALLVSEQLAARFAAERVALDLAWLRVGGGDRRLAVAAAAYLATLIEDRREILERAQLYVRVFGTPAGSLRLRLRIFRARLRLAALRGRPARLAGVDAAVVEIVRALAGQ